MNERFQQHGLVWPATTQAADGNCRRLRVRVTGGNIAYGSSDGAGDFDESGSNRCWAR